ncbi:MAG: hypothetical protein ACLFPF_05275 [Halanaerobiales bacterium]
MRKTISIIIVVLLIAILLILTNPSKDQFINWAMAQAENNANSEVERILGDVIGRSVLELSTSRNSYLLFSTFTIDKGDNQGVFLGIMRFVFIKLS